MLYKYGTREKQMSYLEINQIKRIQLDHTSRCNLFCPQCARTVNKNYPILDLTVEDYKTILAPFDKEKISLFHCGNFGDAIASPTFDETFEYCLDQGVNRIKIATNGSLRTPEWWKNLAIKSKNKLTVVFSIDGLEDTNHLYRVGSKFEKIIMNATSFINHGGIAEWAFIEFKHNYHQIDQAKEFSKKLGFKYFTVKYTARFTESESKTVKTRDKNNIEETDNNHIREDKEKILKKYQSFDEYIMKTPISCKYQQEKTVFIDMNMNLWPCCWLGGPSYFENVSGQTKSFEHLFKIYGRDFNNLRINGWDNVIKHEFFSKYLSKSWNSPSSRKYKRIYTCGRTCGTDFEFSSGYGKNHNKELLDGE